MTYRAQVIGADRLARRIMDVAGDLDSDLQATMRELGQDAELAYAAHAPVESGRLARGVTSLPTGDVVLVIAHAENPATGFDYTGVTRFGHRKAVIRPLRDRAAASSIASRGARAKGRKAMLRFTIDGTVFYRRSVKGYRPTHDWADDALPEIRADARDRTRRLGRNIAVRLAA